jgi:repressor LexA
MMIAYPSLKPREKICLDFLIHFQKESGHSPSFDEICVNIGIKAKSQVPKLLDGLEAKGYISREKNQSRSIRLLQPPVQAVEHGEKQSRNSSNNTRIFPIPLLGSIAAGQPIEFPTDHTAEPGIDTMEYCDSSGSYVEVLQSQLPVREDPSELFALRVRGDSMVEALVNDGDIILVRRTEVFNNGDTVVVSVGEFQGTTLKRIYLEQNQNRLRIRLQPANLNYPPRYFSNPSEVQVIAKMVMVLRQC